VAGHRQPGAELGQHLLLLLAVVSVVFLEIMKIGRHLLPLLVSTVFFAITVKPRFRT
jgi:hypothetical protein